MSSLHKTVETIFPTRLPRFRPSAKLGYVLGYYTAVKVALLDLTYFSLQPFVLSLQMLLECICIL